MGKSSFQLPKYLSKNNIALLLIAAMLIGFLCSRAIGSMAIFLFTVNALRDIPPAGWFRKKWWLTGLIWIAMYAVSWFWNSNQEEWNAHIQVKIPFLLLPLAFSFLPPWTKQELKIFTLILLVTIGAGVFYSCSFLLRDLQQLIESYKYSKTLPTPVYGDHISFSSAVAVCVAWCFYALRLWNSKVVKALLVLTALFFMLYLHVLAAKTGLVALYIFVTGYLICLSVKKPLPGLLITLFSLGCCITAYKVLPTFRERIGYTYYTWVLYSEGQRNGLYSDMGRMISYDVAGRLIREKPLLGVGAGDMLDEMSRGYEKDFPQVTPAQRLIPHNQFMTIALACGIPAMLAFIWWIMIPLASVKRNREGFFFLVIWLMLLVQLFTDPSLEVQFGVFVYLFFFLMQRSLLVQALPAKRQNQ